MDTSTLSDEPGDHRDAAAGVGPRPHLGNTVIYTGKLHHHRGRYLDSAFDAASKILADASSRIDAIRSEEDAKVQIITRLMTEVLGWNHSDIASETHHPNGFSDYLISDGAKQAFVIEAKRIGEIAISASSKSKGYYKISGPVLRSASTGIAQAASYCHPIGLQLAVLTDGVKWIIFIPWVPNSSYTDKQAIVFPSIDSVLKDFSMFYELLSKKHFQRGTYKLVFDRIHENRVVLDKVLTPAILSSENAIVQKSALAFDLDAVFSKFFSGLTGDDDPNMIIECFVETRESRIADFSLERITKNVLGNINPHEKDVGEGLKAIVRGAIAGDSGQTIFIVGPSGAGKSTFLHSFLSALYPTMFEINAS